MRAVPKKTYVEFRNQIPKTFRITTGPEKGSQVADFREIVGKQAKEFRRDHMPRKGNAAGRHDRWLQWIQDVQFDDASWEVIREIDDDTISYLETKQPNIEFYIAVYYRLHAFLDDPSYASKIDELVFAGSLKEQGDPVFVATIEHDSTTETVDKGKISSTSGQNLTAPTLPFTGLFSTGDATVPYNGFKHLAKFHYANRQIGLLGRKDEQNQLHDFLREDRLFLWLQIAGQGGQGKSRLAYEVALGLADSWDVGFLDNEKIEEFANDCPRWRPARPTFIVADYVVGREKHIGKILRVFERQKSDFQHSVRIVLLERQRWDFGGVATSDLSRPNEATPDLVVGNAQGQCEWYGKLLVSEKGEVERNDIENSRYSGGVVELLNLGEAHLTSIVREVAKLRDEFIELSDNEIAEILRNIDSSGRPLYACLLGEMFSSSHEIRSWTREDLLRNVLSRDFSTRWLKNMDETPPIVGSNTASMRLAILANIVGGVDCDDLHVFDSWSSFGNEDRRAALIINDGFISKDFDGVGNTVSNLEPDILGEWMVLHAVSNGLGIDPIMDVAWEVSPVQTAVFLTRVAQDFPFHPSTSRLVGFVPSSQIGTSLFQLISVELSSVLGKAQSVTGKAVRIPDTLVEGLEVQASLRNSKALVVLAFFLSEGIAVQQNEGRAYKLFREAADNNDLQGLLFLAICYRNGIGVDVSLPKAIECYQEAAVLGNYEQAAYVGLCFSNGDGVPKNPVLARKWFEEGAAHGNPMCAHVLAALILDNASSEDEKFRAFTLFQFAAENGVERAYFRLGLCCARGIGTSVNAEAAIENYQKAAEAGEVSAMVNLGAIYLDGTLIEKNPVQSAFWYIKAANAGHPGSMAATAQLFLMGLGVERSFVNAHLMFQKALASGFTKGVPTWIGLAKDPSGERISAQVASVEENHDWLLPPLTDGDWTSLPVHECKELACGIHGFAAFDSVGSDRIISIRSMPLRCYPGFDLFEIQFRSGKESLFACMLANSNERVLLTGVPGPLQYLNEKGYLALSDKHLAEEYMNLHLAATTTSSQAFYFSTSLHPQQFYKTATPAQLDSIRDKLPSVKLIREDNDGYVFISPMSSGGAVLETNVKIFTKGKLGHLELLEHRLANGNLPLYQIGFEDSFRTRKR